MNRLYELKDNAQSQYPKLRGGLPYSASRYDWRKQKPLMALLAITLLIGPTLVSAFSVTANKPFTRRSQPPFTPSPVPQVDPINQELFGAYFLNGNGLSKLIVRNQRIDVPVAVTPVMLVDKGREIQLDPVSLNPNRSLTIDLSQALEDKSAKDIKFGGLVLRYAFPDTGPLDATVTINHSKDKLSLMSPIMGRAEFMSSIQEGVFWLPDKQTEAFVALQNTSSKSRRVTPTLFVAGRPVPLAKITLAPRETSLLNLNNHLAGRVGNLAVAIRLVNDGNPGDIMAEGGLINHKKGSPSA